MNWLNSYVVIGLGLALLGGVLYQLFVLTRRMLRDDGRLRLFDMLRRRGAAAAPPEGEGAIHLAAIAARRCVACRETARCDAWLASGATEGAEAFCPNAEYVHQASEERR